MLSSWYCPDCDRGGEIDHGEDAQAAFLFRAVKKLHEAVSPDCPNRYIPIHSPLNLFDPYRGLTIKKGNGYDY